MKKIIRKDTILIENVLVQSHKAYVRKGKTYYQNKINVPFEIYPKYYDIILIPK